MPAPANLTTDLSDLRTFAAASGPFFSAVIPAPSDVTDADHRFDVRWKQTRRELSDVWSNDVLDALDEMVASLRHDGGAALAIVGSLDGATLTEFLTASPTDVRVNEGAVPSLVPIIEGRQRTIPHLVVETDKTGATLTAFDGALVLGTEEVEGEVFQIHRGRFGGWSHRRFQQRAENTWETNADDVADSAASMAKNVDAKVVAVAGPARAQSMVVEALRDRHVDGVAKIEAGDPDGVAAEVVTRVDDVYARTIKDLSEQYRTQLAADGATAGVDDTLGALVEGRVDVLLVNDDWSDDSTLDEPVLDIQPGARAIDAAVVAALHTDADVVSVPTLGAMNGPLGALLRW